MPTPQEIRPELWRLVLDAYPTLIDADGAPIQGQRASDFTPTPLSGGLINATYALGPAHILQRLHAVFRPEVNLDIHALTEPLRAAGVPVPRLNPTGDGGLWVHREPGAPMEGTWRVLTRLPGRTLHSPERPAQTAHGAAMLARFHAALARVEHTFAFARPGAHDTQAHVARLSAALDHHPEHRLLRQVARLSEEIEARWASLERPEGLPLRIVHGDPKLTNLLFGPDDRVSGVVDLDTMAHETLSVELGDMLRSWTAVTVTRGPGEDVDLSLEVAEAALGGYLSEAGAWLTEAERAAIVPGFERICLELGARFALDALNESYFGWDAQQYATRGDHNVARARRQVLLARCVRRERSALEAMVARG